VKDTYTVSADEEHKALVEKGRYFFTKKCVECHDLDLQRKGPALRDVAGRRDPEWIIKMILNPDYMIKKDPAARALFKKHIIKMVVKDIDLEQAKALLEYLRSVNA
jgi:mono/diheme cytochrome c family protein